MNPNHAACFNELKELCRKYNLRIHHMEMMITFSFQPYRPENIYQADEFSVRTTAIKRRTYVRIPPPEAIGWLKCCTRCKNPFGLSVVYEVGADRICEACFQQAGGTHGELTKSAIGEKDDITKKKANES